MVYLVQLAVDRQLEIPGSLLLGLRSSILQAVLEVPDLGESAEEAWRQAEISDLVSFCLLDRYLRRRFVERWEILVVEVEERAKTVLLTRQPPSSGLLMRLQGAAYRRFQLADAEAWSGWDQAWQEVARAAIRLLAERPRDVSQANAERLLSQQVYTDPGHFLLELLQNADDAGATEFAIDFEDSVLTVRHNGAPFDFRDLVGVLSIGQTTKRSDQIGYFGVGFKSVFEVTDRPRVRSGHFSFEIADVSVPRTLAVSTEDDGLTSLVLPLKKGLDGRDYWSRAVALDPALLLNVPHLRRLKWRDPQGQEVVVSLQRDEGDAMSLHHPGGRRRYLLWKGSYQHLGSRMAGKPAKAHLHLALPLDGVGVGTSLYSFLPIVENSGLRFVVGSHFDVPVDRERLDVSSEWNRGVIASIPRLVSDHLREEPGLAWDLLPLLPLPEDALAPMFTPLPMAFTGLLRRQSIVPDGHGVLRKAAELAVLEQDLQPFFELADEPDLVLVPEPRRRRWLQELGAAAYDLQRLLQELAQGRRPGLLAADDPRVWGLFHQRLSGLSEMASLRELPIFLDRQGCLARPSQLLILEPSWDELFVEPPNSVMPEMAVQSSSGALLTQLGVPHFGWGDLVDRLRDEGPTGFHSELLFRRLMEAPRGIILACLGLPLFADQHGRLGSLVPDAAWHVGLVVATAELPTELFPEHRFVQVTPALDALLESLRWPRMDLPKAVTALAGRKLTDTQAESILGAVLESTSVWSRAALEELGSLPIFQSLDGRRSALSRLLRFEDYELAAILADCPQIAPDSVSERVVEELGLFRDMRPAGLADLLERIVEVDLSLALPYLVSRSGQLSRDEIESLFSAPIFAGRSLARPDWDELDVGLKAAQMDYAEIFQGLGVEVLDLETTRLLQPLFQACAYPQIGLMQLVALLRQRTPPVDVLPQLQSVLVAEGLSLELAFSDEVRRGLPVWLSRDGQVFSAVEIPPSDELAEILGRPGRRPRAGQARELEGLFPFLEPEAYLRSLISTETRMGRPLVEQPDWCRSVSAVDRLAELLPWSHFMVDADDRLRDTALDRASLLAYPWLLSSPLTTGLIHPDSSAQQMSHCSDLGLETVLEVYASVRGQSEIRQAFYRYLSSELKVALGSPEARQFLLEVPLWRSAGGCWKRLDELILDPDIPELGGDWKPHAEVPLELLTALQSGLGIGSRDPLTLLREHLLPAYLSRREVTLLALMSRLAQGLDSTTLRFALRPPDGSGPFPLSLGGDLSDHYCPPEGMEGPPTLEPVTGDQVGFLRRLGLPYLPSERALERAAAAWGQRDGEAMLALVEWAWQQQPEQLEPLWPVLTHLAWLPARDGSMKRSAQLFLRSAEIEELVGDAPELFLQRRLPVNLAVRLGLKQEDDLDGTTVLRHLRGQVGRGRRVTGRLYGYLEKSLASGRLSPGYLHEQLKELPWIWTDEGEYRLAREVLAIPAFRYFGAFRGTWEGAHHRYPRLAALFSIAETVSEPVILAFLAELAQRRDLDAPSLRRLLRSCLAFLGESTGSFPDHWRVLPATVADDGSAVLVAANDPALVFSNSPTLIALFAKAGRLLLADPGDAESASDLAKLYQRLGVRRLRDAYTVRPDRSGREVTQELGAALASFRRLLRGLWSVLPRLRAARQEWDQGEWVAESRLRHFSTSGTIRVLEALRLSYHLPGVATVAVVAALAYDPERGELTVGAEAVQWPAQHAVALADGLIELLYSGPAADGLVDLLNLLIPMGDQETMHSYLDRRHFPRQDLAGSSATGFAQRVGELLDYGLHTVLQRRFPELAGCRWAAWREDLDFAACSAEQAAALLLRALGLERPSPPLALILTQILEAPTLDDLPAELWERSLGAVGSGPESTNPMEPATGLAPAVPRPEKMTSAQMMSSAQLVPAAREISSPRVFGAVGQKVLGQLGQWLGMAPTPREFVAYNRFVPDLADSYRNPPEHHLLVSTKALQDHDLYCLSTVGVAFDQARQIYLPARIPWPTNFVASGRTVEFTGKLSAEGQVLPKPLFSRLARPPAIRGGRATLRGPGGLDEYRLRTDSPDLELAYSVELCQGFEFDVSTPLAPVDPNLLRSTVALEALPSLVRDWIDWARISELSPWQLATRARDFVLDHYQFDLEFLQAEGIQELLHRPLRPGENRALSLLHFGASGRFLGRGVCMELSALLLEMVRRVGIPAVLGGVWALDEGLIHSPDHAIVLVWLASDRGPTWFPLETSLNRTATPSQGESEVAMSRADLLQVAVDLVLGPGARWTSRGSEREQEQEAALLRELGDPRRLGMLLDCIARSGRYFQEIDPELRWLADNGYLNVEPEQLYRVWPNQTRS